MFKIIKKKKLKKLIASFENAANTLLIDEKDDYILFSSFFQNPQGNYGDRIIPKLSIDLLDNFLKTPPSYIFTQAKSGLKSLASFDHNHPPKAVIIGPGGIISGKSEKNQNPKYKWFINISGHEARDLKERKIPIFFWGSGVNIWTHKRLFTDEIKNEICEIFDCIDSAFLRGNADIEFLKSIIPESIHYKLKFQICPSFFTQELRKIKQRDQNSNKVAINIAGDQLFEFFNITTSEMNHWNTNKSKYFEEFSNTLLPFIEHLNKKKLTPVFFCNTTQDTDFAKAFFPHIKRVDTHEISNEYIQIEQLLSIYKYAVGMRLHAWLPFISLGIPSLFLTPFKNRAKMPYDINLPELSCYINSQTEFNLIESFDSMIKNELEIKKNISLQKEIQLSITHKNIQHISKIVKIY